MGWIKNRTGGLGHGAAPSGAGPGVCPLPAVAVPATTEADRSWGCGWLDSSLDLRQGLAVIEHAGIDLGLALEMMFAPEGAALQ